MRFKIYIENSATVKGNKGQRFFVSILTCPVCRSTVIIIPGPSLPFITTFDSSIGITPTCMSPLTKLVKLSSTCHQCKPNMKLLRFHVTLEKVIKIQYINYRHTFMSQLQHKSYQFQLLRRCAKCVTCKAAYLRNQFFKNKNHPVTALFPTTTE